MFIDAHQHFWQYNVSEYAWISENMRELKQNFLPGDLRPLLMDIGFQGSIAVQARQSVEETNWLLQLADQDDFIKGVVGWVDLGSPDIRDILSGYITQPKLVGVRHVVQDEADDHFMLRRVFQHGISVLQEFGLTYDLLLYPRHLPVARQLAEQFPEQSFVLDHIAKPSIRDNQFSPWREDIRELAKFPNVFCKLSGMVTETRWNHWEKNDFKPYLDIAVEAFGTDRIMIGSDWPVCTLSGNYRSTMGIVMDYARQFGEEICAGILGGNCSSFYKISTFDIL